MNNQNNYYLTPPHLIPDFKRMGIYFLRDYIQTIPPFIIDESLDLWTLLKQLIKYCNELGKRNNDLMGIMNNLVTYLNNVLNDFTTQINNYINSLNNEWSDYQKTLNGKYEDFIKTINNDLEQYKEEILNTFNSNLSTIRSENTSYQNSLMATLNSELNKIQNYIPEKDAEVQQYINNFQTLINTTIDNYNTTFNSLETEINNSLNGNTTTLTNLINTKWDTLQNTLNTLTTKINNNVTLANINSAVSNSIDSYDYTNVLSNLYGNMVVINSLGSDETIIGGTSPNYNYTMGNNYLFDKATGEHIPLIPNNIYRYQGRLFIVKGSNTIQTTTINNQISIIPDYDQNIKYKVDVPDNTGNINSYSYHLENVTGDVFFTSEISADYIISSLMIGRNNNEWFYLPTNTKLVFPNPPATSITIPDDAEEIGTVYCKSNTLDTPCFARFYILGTNLYWLLYKYTFVNNTPTLTFWIGDRLVTNSSQLQYISMAHSAEVNINSSGVMTISVYGLGRSIYFKINSNGGQILMDIKSIVISYLTKNYYIGSNYIYTNENLSGDTSCKFSPSKIGTNYILGYGVPYNCLTPYNSMGNSSFLYHILPNLSPNGSGSPLNLTQWYSSEWNEETMSEVTKIYEMVNHTELEEISYEEVTS